MPLKKKIIVGVQPGQNRMTGSIHLTEELGNASLKVYNKSLKPCGEFHRHPQVDGTGSQVGSCSASFNSRQG